MITKSNVNWYIYVFIISRHMFHSYVNESAGKIWCRELNIDRVDWNGKFSKNSWKSDMEFLKIPAFGP